MATDANPDNYDAYYAGKLWALLPAIYQAEDSVVVGQNGPLREVVNRIGAQAAVLRRSIDRLWDDQSIESCDDWVIPYIADLLATRLVSNGDPRGQRLDVAKTVYYRTRKGTLAVLEEIAADITGWDARAVEFFRRMARTHHGLDPAIGNPSASPTMTSELQALQDAQHVVGKTTRMPTYGTADLRSLNTGRLARTAFDELSYTLDARFPRGRNGWYNIPRLGVFLWRLKSYPVAGVTPVVCTATSCPHKLTFDPSGRILPLFAASQRSYGDTWVSPTESQVPGPISRLLVYSSLASVYDALDPITSLPVSNSFGLYTLASPGPSETFTLISPSNVAADPSNPGSAGYYIDPQQGMLYLLGGSPPPAPVTNYHYGFSSEIGAGSYDRRVPGQPPLLQAATLTKGGGSLATAINTAIASPNGRQALVTIGDSLTYTAVTTGGGNTTYLLDSHGNPVDLVLNAGNNLRPLLRLSASVLPVWYLIGTAGSSTVPSSSLTLDGIWIAGGTNIYLGGTFDTVTLNMSTLDPGTAATPSTLAVAADGLTLAPCTLNIYGTVKNLVINRSVTAPIVVLSSSGGNVETMTITDSIVQGIIGASALTSGTTGAVTMERTTVLGPASVHRLQASNSILYGNLTVIDMQHSCLRFTAWTAGSTVPRQYESPSIVSGLSLFTSQSFGDPGYAQLVLGAPSYITSGAEDGSEMGAFSRERNALKESSLLIKLQEYMPVGLSPVIIYVT